jgi:hypothetical protein
MSLESLHQVVRFGGSVSLVGCNFPEESEVGEHKVNSSIRVGEILQVSRAAA